MKAGKDELAWQFCESVRKWQEFVDSSIYKDPNE